MNAKIFINYRRQDTTPYAGRLYDFLLAHFGEDQVLIDIDQIEPPGEDFVEVINRKVGACDIAIVVIGPNWLRVTDASGKRRIDDEEDFVRMEIVAALQRKIRVVPVLVGGARMPGRHDLPDALAPLARRNAIELSETRFHGDVNRLIEAIERSTAVAERKAEPSATPRDGRQRATKEAELSTRPDDGRQRAMNKCVFVCYAREDEKFALGLAANLKKRGVLVWLDQWNISSSSDWDRAIDDALRDSSHLLIVLSPASVESPEVRGELRMALDLQKSIIPVLHQHCEIPRRLRLLQFVDFISRQPDDRTALERTLAAFRSAAARI